MNNDVEGFSQGINEIRESLLAKIDQGSTVSEESKPYRSRYLALLKDAHISNNWEEIAGQIAYLLYAGEISNMILHKTVDSTNMLIEKFNTLAATEPVNLNIQALFDQFKHDLAKSGGISRAVNDPKQKEKAFVLECWQEWQKKPDNYKSKAEFARDMLNKTEHLTSQKKIEDWCREWERTIIQPA